MKDIRAFFALLPTAYVVFGYLTLLQGFVWVSGFLFALSLLFGVLVFGMFYNKNN